jgi:hypothetical protein
MAFYFVNDGTVDVAVAFEDGSEYASQGWFLRVAASADSSEYTQGSAPNISSGVASVDAAISGWVDTTEQYALAFGYGEFELNAPWFDPNDASVGSFSGTLTASITVTADMVAAHGVTGTVSAQIQPVASMAAVHGVTGTLSGSIVVQADIAGTHGAAGVSGTMAAVIQPDASLVGVHGVAGTLAAQIVPVAALSGTHGVTGTLGATITPVAAISGTHGAAGVSGDITAVIQPVASLNAVHGTSGTIAGTIVPVASINALHGVTGDLNASISVQAALTGNHTINGYAGILDATITLTANITGNHIAPYATEYGVPTSPFRRKKKKDEYEQADERPETPKPLEIVKVGKAPYEAITGLVIPKLKTSGIDTRSSLVAIERESTKAKRKQRERIRQLQLADDEWLMLS